MLVQESIGTAVDAIKANKLRSILTTLAIIIGTDGHCNGGYGFKCSTGT